MASLLQPAREQSWQEQCRDLEGLIKTEHLDTSDTQVYAQCAFPMALECWSWGKCTGHCPPRRSAGQEGKEFSVQGVQHSACLTMSLTWLDSLILIIRIDRKLKLT